MSFGEKIDDIKSKEEFVSFVKELSKDFTVNKKDWENRTVDGYLESVAAWVEDMSGYYKNLDQKEPELKEWSFFAKILLSAKFYE